MKRKINALYFSATGTTEKVVTGLARAVAQGYGGESVNILDFTLPDFRKQPLSFSPEDLVIAGVPVIAGRVPNVLLKYLNSIEGNGALAVAVVLYGNRNYDDALIELRDILHNQGFMVIAGGAFIGEHSFSNILAKGRPDEKDMAIVNDFARRIFNKITDEDKFTTVEVKGNVPYRDYYRPKDKNGNPVDIRKVTPKTKSDCIDCKLCAEVCPMGSLDYEDTSKLTGICIKCCACIKKCPVEAKYFDDENYLRHARELEIEFAARREPEIFI